MRGAVLTVAGHDHLVASVAAGVVHPHQLYDSMGTAEALVRVLAEPLPAERRAALAAAGVNVVRHLLPGRSTMLAGTRGGLVLRRVLSMVGIGDDAGRDALDAAVMALPVTAGDAIEVTGALNTSSTLSVRVDDDDVSPAQLFAAALTHGTDVLRDVVALLDAEVGPATETVVAGGWARMACVRRSAAAGAARRDLLTSIRGHRPRSRAHRRVRGRLRARRPHRLRHPQPHPCPAQPMNRRNQAMTTTQSTSLDDIATSDGTFAVVAMDQRNTLKRMYAAVGIDDPAHERAGRHQGRRRRGARAGGQRVPARPDVRHPRARAGGPRRTP